MVNKLIKFALFALGVLVGYSLARRGQLTQAQRREYAALKRSRDGVQNLFEQFRRERKARDPQHDERLKRLSGRGIRHAEF